MRIHYLCCLLLCAGLSAHAQTARTLVGSVTDASNGLLLPGANVYVAGAQRGAVTDAEGRFRLQVPVDSITLVCTFIGYADRKIPVPAGASGPIDIQLQPASITTKEVVIAAEARSSHLESVDMGRAELKMKDVKLLPAFLGEVDVLKTIQLLPGVQSAGDGNAGFYVRGGGPDQNLILMDGAPIYNASHVLGFFSTFNADAVEEVELIKGGMPAQYGGRLSSVLNVSMKEGNMDSLRVNGGIGLIASRITAEGPIQKGKSSFLFSARRTYADVLFRPFFPDTSQVANSQYYFYDLNGKLRWNLPNNSYLTFTGYFGRDVFDFQRSGDEGFGARIPWGNLIGSLQYTKIFSKKLSVRTSLMYSRYDFRFQADQNDFSLELFSGITDYKGRIDFQWYPTLRHNIDFGAEFTHHQFTPSNVSAEQNNTDFNPGGVKSMRAHESAIWFNDEIDLTPDLRISAGLRYTNFIQVGPFTRYRTDDFNQILDTTSYGSGEVVSFYHGLEPRLSFRYTLDARTSIKGGYTRNLQYIHLANFSTLALPTDLWLPSSDVVQPQLGNEWAIGLFRNWFDDEIESSVEVYYKTMENMVEYREGSLPSDDVGSNPDNSLTFGRGWSYGAEFFIKRKFGRLNGWIGYTWSRTMRQFDELNEGEAFPATYDRRHDLSTVATYKLNERWTFSGTFVYGTGAAITLPQSRYVVGGRIVSEYGERNAYRMAPYHRMDIAATLQGKKRKRWQSSWTFAIYNVYNRANPFFIYFDSEGQIEDGSLRLVAKQMSLFPVLPSVTYNFEF